MNMAIKHVQVCSYVLGSYVSSNLKDGSWNQGGSAHKSLGKKTLRLNLNTYNILWNPLLGMGKLAPIP